MMKGFLIHWKGLRLILGLVALGSLLLTGCSTAKPLKESATGDSIPSGPGLFSGESGEYRFTFGGSSDAKKADSSKESSKSAPSSARQGVDEGR